MNKIIGSFLISFFMFSNIQGQSLDIYENDQWGIPAKTGEVRSNPLNQSIDIYENDQWGIPAKTGEVRSSIWP